MQRIWTLDNVRLIEFISDILFSIFPPKISFGIFLNFSDTRLAESIANKYDRLIDMISQKYPSMFLHEFSEYLLFESPSELQGLSATFRKSYLSRMGHNVSRIFKPTIDSLEGSLPKLVFLICRHCCEYITCTEEEKIRLNGICKRCQDKWTKFGRNSTHKFKFSIDNGLLPACPPQVLQNLSPLEVNMISLLITCKTITYLKGGSVSSKGSSVSIPMSVPNAASVLPRVPTGCHIFGVLSRNFRGDSTTFFVNQSNVRAALI